VNENGPNITPIKQTNFRLSKPRFVAASVTYRW